MFQNLKVDIVYYRTNTDFEMEFNLCGCCRMRLLTDKSSDKKAALHSLARAVSRSRIIIITGALFGDDGIINLVSKAIETKLEKVDNKTYGISGDDTISILKGATPLVTTDGYFGGCIIESGPQTMILISENKSIRKPIMEKLIHPYIEQLCAIELSEKAAAVTDTPKNGNEINEPVDELAILEEEYETVAEELIGEQTAEEEQNKTLEEIIEDEDSNLLVENNNEIEEKQDDSVSLEEEYENIADALLTDEESENNKDFAEDTEEDLPLLIEDESEGREEYYLDKEYENIAEALLTEEEAEKKEDEIDVEIRDGIESSLLTEGKTEEKSIELDNEYVIVADSLYTEAENSNESFEPIAESATDIAELEKFASSGMQFDYEDEINPEGRRNNINPNMQHQFFSINVFILMIIAVLLIVLAILCYCIFFVPQSNGLDTVEYIKETFNTLLGKV